jgi:hypothetical protein
VNRRTSTTLLFIFFLICTAANAQTGMGKKPLKEVLYNLEQRYQVRFSYLDSTVEGVVAAIPDDDLPLGEALGTLSRETGLRYEQIGAGSISVSPGRQGRKDLCGHVRDRDGQMLEGATVQARDKLSISDIQGRFELSDVLEEDTLLIRYLGYYAVRVPAYELYSGRCDTITMHPQVTRLSEIIVSNVLTTGIDKRADGSIAIHSETLGLLPGLTDPDILMAVQALPGIQSINETVSDINVRGGTNDQNLLLWEGIRMYQPGHFFGLISAFNPYLIQDVTLIKNGTTASMGEGVSSTILMHTDDDVNTAWHAQAGINMLYGDMLAKIPVSDKMALHLSARRSLADVFQSPTYSRYFERAFRNTDVTDPDNRTDTLVDSGEDFRFYDISAKLLYNPSRRDKIRVNFLNIQNNIGYRESAVIQNQTESRTSGLEQSSLATSISFSRLWSERLRTTATAYLSSYALGAINFDISNDQRLIQENKVMDTGIKLHANVMVSENLDIYTGYQFFENGISNLEDINNPTFQRLIKKVLRSHAAFAEGHYRSASDNTALRAGVRLSYIEKFNQWIPEPRLAFTQRFAGHFTFEVLGELKHQTTSQVIDLQNDFLGVEKRRWVLANDADIPVTQSRQASAGLIYDKNGLLVSVEGYYKQVTGITSSSQGFQNQYQFMRSAGSYDVQGVDVLLNRQFGPMSAWISYAFANNRYTFQDFIPPVFPNNLDIRHIATLGSAYTDRHLQVSAGINWHSGRPYSPPVGVQQNEIAYQTANSARLDDYVRIDLSAKYRFSLSQGVFAELGASVWNITNRRNTVNVFFRQEAAGDVRTIREYALGLTPNVMFRVAF